jgi:hypothetical protein
MTDYWSDHLEGMQAEQEERDEALAQAVKTMRANDKQKRKPK